MNLFLISTGEVEILITNKKKGQIVKSIIITKIRDNNKKVVGFQYVNHRKMECKMKKKVFREKVGRKKSNHTELAKKAKDSMQERMGEIK